MADGGASEMADRQTEELIDRIKLLHDELRRLEVKPEYINFKRLSLEGLRAELEAVSEQLERRKRFLGV